MARVITDAPAPEQTDRLQAELVEKLTAINGKARYGGRIHLHGGGTGESS